MVVAMKWEVKSTSRIRVVQMGATMLSLGMFAGNFL